MIKKNLAGLVFSLFSTLYVASAQQGVPAHSSVSPMDSTSKNISVEEKILNKNTMIVYGTSNLEDISVSFAQRLRKNKLLCVGAEYSYQVVNNVRQKEFAHGINGCLGYYSDNAAIMFKSGIFLKDNNTYFNYGAEILVTFEDETRLMPIVGVSLTRKYIQLKCGIAF